MTEQDERDGGPGLGGFGCPEHAGNAGGVRDGRNVAEEELAFEDAVVEASLREEVHGRAFREALRRRSRTTYRPTVTPEGSTTVESFTGPTSSTRCTDPGSLSAKMDGMTALGSDRFAARAIAYYLPQFHPVPENDEWWGPGFTEWTNTTKARPLFRGHDQPHLPQELGFTDLRVPEVREAQAALAAEHGVAAFCYWHYWFGGGRRILERPFAEVLGSGRPDFPFLLGWANQTWTGVWHGAPDRVLVEQSYLGAEDDRRHFDAILPAFRDPRYFRVHGKPVFYVFRPEQLPDAAAFVDRWQAMARAAGIDGLYLVAEVVDHVGQGTVSYAGIEADGFDAGVYARRPARRRPMDLLRMRVLRRLGGPRRYPYSTDPSMWDRVREDPRLQPSVVPNWDNTPRTGANGIVLEGSSPRAFEQNVRTAVETLAGRPSEERLLWVKSWNEWAEGNYLEPDLAHGRGWLTALRDGLSPVRAAAA